MTRFLVALLVLLAPGSALAERPTFYILHGAGYAVGRMEKYRGSYSPPPSDQYVADATRYGSAYGSLQLAPLRVGMRYWLAFVDLSIPIPPFDSDGHSGPYREWELNLGLSPPRTWPVRHDGAFLKLIPSIAIGVGGNVNTEAIDKLSPKRERIVSRSGGTCAIAALLLDVRLSVFLLRVSGRYRAIFSKQQFYQLTDQDIYPDVDAKFDSNAFSWDVGFNVAAGVEF